MKLKNSQKTIISLLKSNRIKRLGGATKRRIKMKSNKLYQDEYDEYLDCKETAEEDGIYNYPDFKEWLKLKES